MRVLAAVVLFLVAGCDRASRADGKDASVVQNGGGASSGGATKPASTAFDACTRCGAVVKTGALASPAIVEASGLAASAVHAGVYYVHNDSGDTPRFFAIDASGKELARYSVGGAYAVDWEDLATGPCPQGRCVFLGDVGDNPEQRSSYTVYRVVEPSKFEPGEHDAVGESLSFKYPDGSHNCETLLVHPDSGELYVVTKVASGPSAVYRFPMPITPGKTAVLEKVATVKPPTGLAHITAGSIHPKGAGILLRTYTNLFYYPMSTTVAAAFESTPCALSVASEKQGEAVAWTAAGDGYLTVSEGASAALSYVSCP
jgi:hypothetical protein